MSDTKPELSVGFQLPGEGIGIATINGFIRIRETMSQENRDRADKLFLDSVEQNAAFWTAVFKPLVDLIRGGK